MGGAPPDLIQPGWLGSPQEQGHEEITPQERRESLGHLIGLAVQDSRRAGLCEDLFKSGATRLPCLGLQYACHLRCPRGFGDCQPEGRYYRWVTHLAEPPGCKNLQHTGQSVPIAYGRSLSGSERHPGGVALGDAGNEHVLLAANQRVELSLRDLGARGDLKGAGA